ncbi:YdeI/OmpD-associated family protein [Clostridium sporogenes]|uniref:YdeI/OmpD-associated family protein n=1 Tax=Clostridium sporogenes TaxID=1509 RepID=UPI002900ADF8|nr:YdeI/OmpD-associated family protein [Clostridium botulinum]
MLTIFFYDTKNLKLSFLTINFYESLSYSEKRKYIQWITSAKKEESKIKRMEEAIVKLENKIKI